MGKNYAIINDIDSRKFPSLLIEELPAMQLPEKRVEEIEVEGRDGVLTITDDCYMNTQKTMTCKLRGNENVDQISLWLYNCKKVIFSNRPDRYYKAMIKSQVDFERSLSNNRSFSVVFDCQPFGYLIDNSTITITKNNSSFEGKGTYWSKPIIKVYGNGELNVTINNTQVTLKDVDEYITINSEKKRTHKDLTLLNNKKVGNFPTLSHERNTISWTGSISKIEIIPNWRCLI